MPLTHERTFRIRHYECDAYGHLNNANYLRYMQETAFDASAAAGYDMDRYEELGTIWLIRETDIEYQRPLRYGEHVTLRTWVLDFRRVRSRRMYEFIHVESGERAARAITDWVYLHSDSGRPARIGEEMIRGFFPDGPPEDVPPRERFPSAPEPPPGVFKAKRRVEWRDIDPVGHVNNATYLAYIEEAGVQVSAAHGWPMRRMFEEGFGIIARRHRIEYRQPALQGNEVEIATWVSDVRGASATRHYTIKRTADDAQLARARTVWVWVDVESGRPIRIPEGFMDDFAPNVVNGTSG